MTPIISCFACVYFNAKKLTCKAFQKGIPRNILSGENDHTKKHPDQKNDILFEPKD